MKRKCSKGEEIKAEVSFFQIRKCSAIYSNKIQCWCESNWFGWLPFPPSCWAAQRAVGERATSNSGRWGIELIKKRYIKLGILWTCLLTWLMLMSQVTDVALWIWYKFPVVLPGNTPPRPCSRAGTGISDLKYRCWNQTILGWINSCGCVNATTRAGEGMRMGD